MSKIDRKSFRYKFYLNIAPIITGVGASVAIAGALFKIMHWPGAALMLIAGLGTEALLFLLFAFAPQHEDPDWSKVYPQLADDHVGVADPVSGKPAKGAIETMDDMLQKAKVDQALLDKLGKGFSSLSESVGKIGDLSSASVATSEYARNVKSASDSLVAMNKSYGATVTALNEFSGAATEVKNYGTQISAVNKNLSALNSVYELQLQDTQKHLTAMKQFYTGLSGAMQSIADASKDASQVQTELSQLTTNINALNSIYGGVLSAMRGNTAQK